jgi:uncharacterized membrane protein YgaE (UPF0421/DUF939 family)
MREYIRSLLYGVVIGTIIAALFGMLINSRDIGATVSLLVSSAILFGILQLSKPLDNSSK